LVGSRGARVTADPDEAARLVATGSPVVLVGASPTALAAAVSTSGDNGGRQRLLAVMVGDPEDPAVMAAAGEMAGELWPSAGDGGRAEPEPTGEDDAPGS
jgi:hypothetical protein